MAHSNSSLNCFAECMAKFEHRYILKTPPCKPDSPHLKFGSMAHDVLHKAGQLRDAALDGIVEKGDYFQVIPSEVLYTDLKDEFGIRSWERYFTAVIKQTAEYEQQLIEEICNEDNDGITVLREVKVHLSVEELKQLGFFGIEQSFTGVIDLLILTSRHAYIVDYKFSTKKKTQDDFDMDSQLPFYSFFVRNEYAIELHNIKYGYIDIPKTCFGEPTILSNGTLSRAKDQNVSQEIYAKAVKVVHESRNDYKEEMLQPGGYYYDAWCNFALNKAAYLQMQWLDNNVYYGVMADLINTARMIDKMIGEKLPFLKKYSGYTCKDCEYLNTCKPWLMVGNK